MLNSVGVYTKLTRLVVDSDWDRKSFAFQWIYEDKNETLVTDANGDEIEVVEERGEKRSREKKDKLANKRRKVEEHPGLEWGVHLKPTNKLTKTFLYCKAQSLNMNL